MTHDEYVARQRARAGLVAERVMAGELTVLEGAHLITRLDLDVPGDDEDLATIRSVNSETDSLPIGDVREHWSESALQSKEAEIREAEKWARDTALAAFGHLAERFRAG
jgi:hypothetical protein